MIDQLKSLSTEMVQEIKNLKDLTKETLPEVAKEYVKFNMVLHLFGLIFFGIGTLIGTGIIIHGLLNNLYTERNYGFLQMSAVFVVPISGFFTLYNLISLLSFYFQPRTKAIEGVVKLFKGDNNG